MGIGFINPETKKAYINIVAELEDKGAECIILGCTEIPLLIGQEDFTSRFLTHTKYHSKAIVDYVLS